MPMEGCTGISAGLFIDQDIFIFIKNGKRHRNRDDSVGINSFAEDGPGNNLRPEAVLCHRFADRFTGKSFFVGFHRREDVSGKSLLPKKVQYGRAPFIFCDLIMKNSIHNSPRISVCFIRRLAQVRNSVKWMIVQKR